MRVQTTARLRLTEADADQVKEYAKNRKASVSAVIRQAMEVYLNGDKALPKRQPNAKETTFACYVEDFVRFKDLAQDAGVPWDEAIRLAIHNLLQTNVRSPT